MNTFKIFRLIALSLAAVACSGDDENIPPEKTVNDITLDIKQRIMPLSSFDIGQYPVYSILVGNSIYFGNASNIAKPQFFVRYNLGNNTFSQPLANSNNVCACGYSSSLVSDGTNVFYIANDATKYTASSNTWSNINYPPTAKDNNGEAGVGYYNGNIYFIGGRTPSTLFKYYSISQNQWFTLPNYLYPTNRSQLTSYKDRIYILGGENAKKKMSFFNTTDNSWVALTDTPFEINSSYDSKYAATLGDNLYLLQYDKIYIYDLIKNEWANEPITLSGPVSYGNLFSDGQKLYIAGKNSSNIPVVFDLGIKYE
jgi:hypothetical protein